MPTIDNTRDSVEHRADTKTATNIQLAQLIQVAGSVSIACRAAGAAAALEKARPQCSMLAVPVTALSASTTPPCSSAVTAAGAGRRVKPASSGASGVTQASPRGDAAKTLLAAAVSLLP